MFHEFDKLRAEVREFGRLLILAITQAMVRVDTLLRGLR